MTTWPEFEFDSEFESASEYSTHPTDSSPASASAVHSKISVNPVPNCQVTLAILWNHNTQSYQRSCPALDPVKRQPKIVVKSQPPNVGIQKQPLKIGIQIQPDQSQPPYIQSQDQPPAAKKPGIQTREQPQNVVRSSSQLLLQPERKQPLSAEAQSQSQPLNSDEQSHPPVAKSGHQPAPDLQPDPDPVVIQQQSSSQLQCQHPAVQAPDLPPDPDPPQKNNSSVPRACC